MLTSGTRPKGERVRAHGKRVSIGDLLTAGLVSEGDQWRLSTKGEVVWGRIESNGQLRGERRGSREPEQGLPRRDRLAWQRVVLLALPRRQR